MLENKPAPEGVTEITDDMIQKVGPVDEAFVEAGLAQEATPAETVIEKAMEAPDTADEALAELANEAEVEIEPEQAAEEALAAAEEELDKIAA